MVTSTSSTGTRSAKGTPSASSWSFTCWVMGARLRVTAPFPSPSRRARWTAPCASRLAAFQPVRKVSVVVNERMALSTNSATASWSGPVSSSRMTRSVTAAAMSAWMCSFEASGSIVPTYSSASPMSSRAHPERMASGTSSAVTTSSTPEAVAEKPRPARRARDGARAGRAAFAGLLTESSEAVSREGRHPWGAHRVTAASPPAPAPSCSTGRRPRRRRPPRGRGPAPRTAGCWRR